MATNLTAVKFSNATGLDNVHAHFAISAGPTGTATKYTVPDVDKFRTGVYPISSPYPVDQDCAVVVVFHEVSGAPSVIAAAGWKVNDAGHFAVAQAILTSPEAGKYDLHIVAD
jgi:dienelactone hydrolase